MALSLDDPKIDALITALDEATRASAEATKRFVEPAVGTLSKALAKQHQMVFGRRGSGKSSLLRKAIAEFNLERRPSAYVDLESFKGHSYPDVLISILSETFESIRRWLDEAAVAPANRAKIWERWFSRPRRGPLSRQRAAELSMKVSNILDDLHHLLHAQDNVEIERRSGSREEATSASGFEVGLEAPIGRAGASLKSASSAETSEETLERLRRSKADYLHRAILTYQTLLDEIASLSDGDGLLILDDLYHIRRNDQPLVLDYFHRLAKGHRMWLKVGTIRHRSSWYRHGDPPIGMKLGDDAGEINLDITLERYSQAKRFLVQVIDGILTEVGIARLTELMTDGAIDRLVLASGGVARDFLTILNRSIAVARVRGEKRRGAKINAEDVNQAAGEHEATKREELRRDTGEEEPDLDAEFRKIRDFCLEDQNVNCFLVNKDDKSSRYAVIQELVDLRLLHLVNSRVTVRSRSRKGKLYEAYLLDFSQYTGERKKRNLTLIEFWRTGAEDELRKAKLIYELDADAAAA
jgi:hypothetical protein